MQHTFLWYKTYRGLLKIPIINGVENDSDFKKLLSLFRK